MQRARVKIALATYIAVALIIVLGNSFISNAGFHTEYTISRYIGLSAWSAIFFALSCFFIFNHLLRFLNSVKKTHQMNFLWWILSLIVIIALICVGLFPVGYFDETFGEFGTVSILHRTSAFIMFCTTIPLVLLTALKFRRIKLLFISCLVFVVYGLAFVVAYTTNFAPFMSLILFFEAFFLAFFLAILLQIPTSPEESEKNPKKLDK